MDFELSEEHKMLREVIRNFVEKEIAPLVDEAEAKEQFPVQLFPMMGELGYLCANYPTEYGGGGMGMIGECIVIEEVGRVCLGIAAGLLEQCGTSVTPILEHGTEEQKQKYVVAAAKGQKIGAFALTEPNAGSDAASIETTAVKKGDKYIINGSKIFITNGPICDFVVTAAYTDKSLGASKGISLFIVDADTPGLTRTKMEKFCMRATENAELFFEDCAVPAENLIGEEGRGFIYVLENLEASRIARSAIGLGIAQAAYEAALDYVQHRVQFGQPIYKFQVNAFKVARMATDIEAARWLMYRAAWLHDQGVRRFNEAPMLKLFASEVACRVTADAMQIHGGYALMSDSKIQRYFRDARAITITDGTDEIQQVVISRGLGLR